MPMKSLYVLYSISNLEGLYAGQNFKERGKSHFFWDAMTVAMYWWTQKFAWLLSAAQSTRSLTRGLILCPLLELEFVEHLKGCAR